MAGTIVEPLRSNTVNNSFLQVLLNASTGFPGIGNRITLDTVVLSSGSDIVYSGTPGIFNLAANRTYRLSGVCRFTGSPPWGVNLSWYDITAATAFGAQANVTSPTTATGSNVNYCVAYITTSVATQVELRVTNASGSVTGVTGQATNCEIESQQAVIPAFNLSYVRRSGGTLRGSTNTNVVRFSSADASTGTDITYVPDATFGDSFLVNVAGVYSVSTTSNTTAANSLLAINVGALQNLFATSDIRSVISGDSTSASLISTSWVGFIPASSQIYILCNSGSAAPAVNNQVSISRLV